MSLEDIESLVPPAPQGDEGPRLQGGQLRIPDVLPHQKETVHGELCPRTEEGESWTYSLTHAGDSYVVYCVPAIYNGEASPPGSAVSLGPI